MTVKAIYDGKTIRPLDTRKIDAFKGALKPNEYVELTFKRWSDSRTSRQNRYLHSLIQRYAKALGYSVSFAKTELCCEFGVAEKWDEATFTPPDYAVKFELYHLELWMRKSTTEYTTKEMKELIDGIKMACFENDIDISDIEPEDA